MLVSLRARAPLVSMLLCLVTLVAARTAHAVDERPASLDVVFPGLDGVHVEVKLADGVDGSAGGRRVAAEHWRSERTTLAVPADRLDVVIRKGAGRLVIDDVDCTPGACKARGVTAVMMVSFPGMTSVHVRARVDDGVDGTATGGTVNGTSWQSRGAVIPVLRGVYDVLFRHGGASLVVDGVDCRRRMCKVAGVTTTATVRFPGLSAVHVDARVPDGVSGAASGADATRAHWRSDETTLTLLRGRYDLRIRHGGATHVVDALDCRGPSCLVDGLTSSVEVRFPGLSSVHTDARIPDGIAGEAGGAAVTASNWRTDSAALKVLRGVYDIRVRQGATTYVADDLDCRADRCLLDDMTAALEVRFPGLSSVHTDARMPDGVDGEAGGGRVASSNWRTDGAVLKVLRGVFDVRVRQGGTTYVVDDLDCRGDRCLADDMTASLEVRFPGLSGVHTDARMPDGVAGAAGGDRVASANWRTGEADLAVLRGVYDVRIRQGGTAYVVDALDCRGDACVVDGVTSTMKVSFPGMSGVHTDARVPDGEPGVAAGDRVASANWRTDGATLEVLKGRYDVRIRQGGSTYVVDALDCFAQACVVDGVSATIKVSFPGLSGVHTDARRPDGEAGVAGGDRVTSSNWRRDGATLEVLRGHYDVRIRQGGATYVVDGLDCSAAECLVDGVTATATVRFDGVSSAHTDARVPDGESGAATGERVASSNWRTDGTTLELLRGVYDIRIRQGGATLVVDSLDCRSGRCLVDDVTATVTVDFEGMASVHTDARMPDDVAGDAAGAEVARSNWRSDEAVLTVLRGRYDLRVRHAAAVLVVDDVDCRGAACAVEDITATMRVRFPGLHNVHTIARLPDGVEGSAEGDRVGRAGWRAHEASLVLLRQRYDVAVHHGAVTVFDELDCTGGSCEATVTGNAQVTLVDGDAARPIANRAVTAYEKLPSGRLVLEQRGTTSPEGVIHFTLGDLGAGRIYVLKTYDAFGNGKTYYSPLVRRTGPFEFRITREGDYPLDDTPPRVNIVSHFSGGNVAVEGFEIAGTATDDNQIESVALRVRDTRLGESTVQASFDAVSGTWRAVVTSSMITVDTVVELVAVATDRAQNEATASVSLSVIEDRSPPTIAFLSHGDGDTVDETGFLVSGSVADETSVAALDVTLVRPDGSEPIAARPVAFDPGSGSWTVDVRNGLVLDGERVTVRLSAVDGRGNAASASLVLEVGPGGDLAMHMINRITFGVTPALLAEVDDDGALAYLARQLDPDSAGVRYEPGFEPATGAELQRWLLLQMARSPRQLEEVMTWFWENHFSTDLDKTGNAVAYELAENRAFRANALGNFLDLLVTSAQSPSMIHYLDSISNVRGDANENYAREVMELSTMGVDGGYTARDIEAAAELFTGWHEQGGAFFFNVDEHNPAPQTVLGVDFPAAVPGGGVERGEDLLAVLAAHPSTARYICGKLIVYFVDEAVPGSLAGRCADRFGSTVDADDQIRQVLELILTSPEFAGAYRTRLKTPLDLVVGAVRALEAAGDGGDLAEAVDDVGLDLFRNPIPTGYSVLAADWMNTNLLAERIKWVNRLAREPAAADVTYLEPAVYLRGHGYVTAEGIVGFLSSLLYGDRLSPRERATALEVLEEGGPFEIGALDAEDKLRRLLGTMLSFPSYQYK